MAIFQIAYRLTTSFVLACCFLGSGFAHSPSSPQTLSIALQGNVRNSAGEPVADASVALLEQGRSNSVQTKTSSDGKFAFVVPHPGTYTIVAEKAGIRSRDTEPLQLSTGQKKNVQLVLDISAASSGNGEMEFEDKPNFTVAGVTDWSGAGGHGSDTSLRTSESLARDTLALKTGPPNSTAASLAAKEADEHRRKGELDECSGDALGAVHEFELAASIDPSEQNYFAWGTELLLHRAIAPATAVFRKGSSAHPNSARMLAGLGAALYSEGSYVEAAIQLCHASDLEPENLSPYLFIGKMVIAASTVLPCGDEKLARFLEQHPENALANYYFAMALLKRGRDSKNPMELQKAQAMLEKSVTIDPKLGEAYLQLGIIYAGKSETERAITAYTKAFEVNSHLIEAHYRLSQLYKRLGEKAKSEQEIQLYRAGEKSEADAVERQRHEVQQFLIILKEPATSPN
jgi:tetratricopeptide (TPR) repeat protein